MSSEAVMHHSSQWSATELARLKRDQDVRVAVVIPARNEAATVGAVVAQIDADLRHTTGLVDELVVMDSLSTDATADAARAGGATVHSVAEVRPDLGVAAGKGEALWKSLFVTGSELIVFVDADLLDWGVHFVTGLLGPLLTRTETLLVKGFYDRVFDDRDDASGRSAVRPQGGRVTELVARPLLTLRWPQLSGIVQPLAGEWAVRRELIESLPIPSGYGVELATLLDTESAHGVGAIAQVDLGRRAHRHQTIHDLGVMACEIIAVADRRSALRYPTLAADAVTIRQYERATRQPPAAGADQNWTQRRVPLTERPPRRDVS